MSDIANGVIQVLDQLKGSGQLNDYLIDDDERKWTKLVYDIMVNKFDMPFGKGTMQQASDIFNNAVRIWKGKNKVANMMSMESKQTNKKLIRLTESDLHNIVKESVDRILKEYTGDFGYSDDPNYNKVPQQNRPQQKQTPPLANYQPKRLGGNLVSNDDGESYIWDDSQQRQFGNNGTVEESTVNEVKYNGVSYHGTNPYDWVDVADERSQMGWKNRDDVSKYNQARFKAKDQGDLEGAEAASIMADKHRQQWNKNWGAAERNRNNAKQLGWQGQNDTRLGKAQEYYNMSQNAQTPQDRQRYNKMAQDTLGDVEGRAQKSLNMLRAARGQA